MSEPAGPGSAPGQPSGETYDICLLLEQTLSHVDAEQVTMLHQDWADPVHYHVLLPAVDAGGQMEATLATLGTAEVMAAAPIPVLEEDAQRAQAEATELSARQVADSVAVLQDLGASADGEVVLGDPVERLGGTVRDRGTAEVIIITRAHLIAETFHTDWTHRARKILGVPLLHMLAHRDHDAPEH
jgi:hypothetical protein